MTTALPPRQPYVPVPPPPPSLFRQHFVALLVAAIALVIALGALGVWLFTSVMSSAQPAASAPTAQAASPSLPQSSSTGLTAQDQQFLGMLRTLPDVPAVSDQAGIISAGHDICSDLARGMGAGAETYSIAGQSQLSVNGAGEVVGAAIMSYCPQFRSAAGI